MTPTARLLRSPVAQFLGAGLLVLVVLVVVTNVFAARAAREEAINDARATTELLAHSVAETGIPRGLVDGRPGAVDRFDTEMRPRLVVADVVRVKIWDREGTILWSDEARLIRDRFGLDDDKVAVLDDGGTEAGVSDVDEPENRYEDRDAELVEVYTRIESPEGEPLLFETYFAADRIDRRQAELVTPFRTITVSALVAVLSKFFS